MEADPNEKTAAEQNAALNKPAEATDEQRSIMDTLSDDWIDIREKMRALFTKLEHTAVGTIEEVRDLFGEVELKLTQHIYAPATVTSIDPDAVQAVDDKVDED